MVALTETAPAPGKTRAQRRREERQARKSLGGTGLRPVPSSDRAFPGGTGVPPVTSSTSPSGIRVGQNPPAPPLDALIADYLGESLSLPDLAAKHSLSLTELCATLESPEFTELLERLSRLAEKRARDIATHTRAGALRTLESVCATAINPETARKAASTLIRASDRVMYPARKRAADPAAQDGAGVGAAERPCASTAPDDPTPSPAPALSSPSIRSEAAPRPTGGTHVPPEPEEESESEMQLEAAA